MSETRLSIVDDLLILIALTPFGARVSKLGRERWAIDCASRAVSATVESLGPELRVIRAAIAASRVWLTAAPSDDERGGIEAEVARGLAAIQTRAAGQTRARVRLDHERAGRAVEAIQLALVCAIEQRGYERVAELARSAFPQPELEAGAQARRLLIRTQLLPSGAELLVRLDYAESRGLLPTNPDALAWIEAQRTALMTEAEASRMALVLRHLELLFAAELDRV